MIKKDELKPLIEKEAATNSLLVTSGIFLAVAAFLSIISIKDIFSIINDNSIPLVVCPKAYELDSPVIMKTISEANLEKKDQWIKGFMRRFMQRQFPRSAEDAEESLNYIVNHSTGSVRNKYLSYLDNLDGFKSLVGQKYYYAFYPTNTLDIRIRSTGKTGEWIVEMDGFMIRYVGDKESRSTPTLRYTVQALEHTLENPEGLYVVDSNILDIADYVSGRQD